MALGLASGVLCVSGIALLGILYATLPEFKGLKTLPGLSAPVTINSDRYAIPTINAENRLDAFRALGFVAARDRMFQLELFRRSAEGRLAEVFGSKLVPLDRQQRNFGFAHLATRILKRLPQPQRQVLLAYSEGVNAYLEQHRFPSLELTLLGIQPAAWKPEHSILVALHLFQALNFTGHQEAMLTIMTRTLPNEVVAFLTPDSDPYSETLIGGRKSRRFRQSVPVESLEALYRSKRDDPEIGARIRFEEHIGSNAWVVNRLKTADGRAILANDMHLPLIAPNLWYRARLRYPNTELSGITLPGLPLLISGSNNQVAWGYTNALADVIDLVMLDINPRNENEYSGPEGWLPFETRHETIRVRGGGDVAIRIRHTLWGPVSNRTLLGKLTAIRWTALDPEAVDLALIDLDRTKTLDEAIALFNRAGVPVLHVMLADANGGIAWTLTGRIPKRRGFDGSVSLPWGNRPIAWNGYLRPDELPRIKDPASGFIVTANNFVIGSDYPYPIGQNFANGYRASRIRELLSSMNSINEAEMLGLQADTRAGLYDFYRDLALSVLGERAVSENPELRRIKENLIAWNGRAESDSRGFGVLFGFRRRLAAAIILPLLDRCYAADSGFYYSWFNMDTPLRQILSVRPPNMLPRSKGHRSWDDLILKVLIETVVKLEERHRVRDINQLVWSDINPVRITHPFTRAIPALSGFLDLPEYRMSGCTFCINVMAEGYGVTERLIVSPGHHDEGLLQMPGGQSGHPFSEHYADQHVFWAKLLAMPLEPEEIRYSLRLIP
ncbi:MAG: penicillin acylase family protein [Methylococcaceae bacterium]|nr:penicillin acylase family protein [Methylococcaceae bacterium]